MGKPSCLEYVNRATDFVCVDAASRRPYLRRDGGRHFFHSRGQLFLPLPPGVKGDETELMRAGNSVAARIMVSLRQWKGVTRLL